MSAFIERLRVAVNALRERLARPRVDTRPRRLSEELRDISERSAALPILDSRRPEDILGYDEHGVPR